MSFQGGNYLIEVHGDRATARVWKRPDLDTASGAQDAVTMVATLTSLARNVRSLLFDLREAPVIAGPKTVEALGELLRAYENAGTRIAVLITTEPLQSLQLRRLVATYAPTRGRLTFDPDEAEAWTDR